MGVFNLLIIVPVVALYGLFGMICLKLLSIRFNFSYLILFVVSGIVSGTITMFLYGVLVADASGHLKSAEEVIGMFVVSGLAAVSASVFSAKAAAKYNQSFKSGTPQSGAP